MEVIMNIEEEILKIQNRNKEVEFNKAWETSTLRKFMICSITYLFISLTMYSLEIEKPLINAIIPTLGFFLSTLSLNFAKKVWIKKHK